VSDPGATGEPRSGAPIPRRDRERAKGMVTTKREGRGGLGVFLLVGALPAAGIVWVLLLPQAERDALLARVPEGWAGRAAHAGIAFGALVLLARVALPAFHGGSKRLQEIQASMAARRGVLRVLLWPLEALVHLLGFVARVLFAVDAVMILACCLVLLLLVARIIKPELLPGILPTLGR
jgi:hypothetical protein